MNTTSVHAVHTPRTHPNTAELFRKAEGRHFTDEELAVIEKDFPGLKIRLTAAKEIRSKDVKIIGRVIKEIFAQYPYESAHELANPKCTRDVRYVVVYAVHSMIADHPKWFEDKILIWLKTILYAFEFPDRSQGSGSAIFADQTLEAKLKTLPKKVKSIFHTYYRLKQEMDKDLAPEHFALIAPYLDQAINVLSEKY